MTHTNTGPCSRPRIRSTTVANSSHQPAEPTATPATTASAVAVPPCASTRPRLANIAAKIMIVGGLASVSRKVATKVPSPLREPSPAAVVGKGWRTTPRPNQTR